VRLKVISADTMLPVVGAVVNIHALLVRLDEGEDE
jgi:hypothetical protein